MTTMPTPNDILAAGDVLNDVIGAAEDADFVDMTKVREELLLLKKQVADAIAAVEMEMLRQVEKNPREVNGVVYTRAPKRRVTTNHDAVLLAATTKARMDSIDPATGEFVHDPIELTRDIFASLYLSPSVKAKRAGLTHIGLTPQDVESSEIVGYELRVVE